MAVEGRPHRQEARENNRGANHKEVHLKELTKIYCLVQESNLGLLLPFCGGGLFSQGVKRHPDFIVVHIGAATGHRTRGLQLFF